MRIFYKNSGSPAHPFSEEPCGGYCATCGEPVNQGVAHAQITGTSFGRQSDFLKFGDHVCTACAWMYAYPKHTHRNVMTACNEIWWPMISHDTATEVRPDWHTVLQKIAGMPDGTIVQGVLTTDPKPRLWPMTQPMTVRNFGLYVHANDYDVSEFRQFSLTECLDIAGFISDRLTEGYNKRTCFFGVLSDYGRLKRAPEQTLKIEATLKAMRTSPAFVPGLLIAGKKKMLRMVYRQSLLEILEEGEKK